MQQSELHPIFNAQKQTDTNLIEPFNALRPLNIFNEKTLIKKIISMSFDGNTTGLSLAEFLSLDHAYALFSITGWLLHNASMTQIEKNCRNLFTWSILEYLENKPIKKQVIQAIFGKNAIEKGNLIIPLSDINENIPFSRDNSIIDYHVVVPPHVYMDKIPTYFESSFKSMISFFESKIEQSIKNEIKNIFQDIVDQLLETGNVKGPWLLYEFNADPYLKFAVDILLKDASTQQTLSIVDIRDAIEQYYCRHVWEQSFKNKLLKLDDRNLMQVYEKAQESKKFPEIRLVDPFALTIQNSTKITLKTIEDIHKLKQFPCMAKAIESSEISHDIRTAFFSTLLWFFSKAECHQILKSRMNDKKYNQEIAEKQINSLIDIDNTPKYIYGTRGFGKYCIGYSMCPQCWIKALDFPENYYHKKDILRQRYNLKNEVSSKCQTPSPIPKMITV
ncbi:hypothetical protein [uncultured Methanomethylovorans sp.]|uniref:hypothetical protein n=1 Tax=uncultured Methanomethylovorans sp. TaxID=183759 RepID=UPI002AA7726F|nr:hypothetical protein [uncultured Methanomethylovorans sp.]